MKKILFTKKLTRKQQAFARKKALLIDDLPFIDVVLKKLSQKEVNLLEDARFSNWVFTSRNAVRAVLPFLSPGVKEKKIFCVGQKTAECLEKRGFKALYPKTAHSQSLVRLLQKEKANDLLYFCGNRRRNTLPDFFNVNNIHYREIQVYNTQLTQPEINIKDYAGICFCSPSAVQSFFSQYKPAGIPYFVIGQTTAHALKKYASLYFVAKESSIQSVIALCSTYFSHQLKK